MHFFFSRLIDFPIYEIHIDRETYNGTTLRNIKLLFSFCVTYNSFNKDTISVCARSLKTYRI